MENEDRTGRKRTLFRRTRENNDFDSPPLGSLSDNNDDDGWVDISANPQAQAALDAEQRAASPRKTASMFAPKEKWTETWGDDAWDDEWSDPTARRSSVPPAASPGPDQIDAWLSTDSESWGDVTRETIQKMGADPKMIDAPGATWDTDQKALRTTTNTEPSDIELAIEKALASVTAEVSSPVAAPVPAAPVPAAASPMIVVDSRLSTPAPPKTRFRRGATNLAPSPATTTVDLTDPPTPSTDTNNTPDAPPVTTTASVAPDLADSNVMTDSNVVTDSNIVTDSNVMTASFADDAATDTATDAAVPATETRITTPIASGGSEMEDTQTASAVANVKLPVQANAADRRWVSDTDATGDLSVPSVDQSGRPESSFDADRAHSFVDRVSWIGTGVALVAALRLVALLWAGSRAANPAGGLNAVERIGRGFSEAGVVQALLLIVAVALLIVPSLFDDEQRSGRIGTGLGLIIGASTLGLVGSLFAYLSDRRLADIAGNATGSFTLRALAALVATAGMSIVAWAAAVRSLRSDS